MYNQSHNLRFYKLIVKQTAFFLTLKHNCWLEYILFRNDVLNIQSTFNCSTKLKAKSVK